MYLKRDIEKLMIKAKDQFQAIVVYGARQVGKSTTINMLFKDFNRVSLDNIDDRNLANSNPQGFLQVYKWPLIIDEVQKAPNLLEYIKIIIDNQKLEWLKDNKQSSLMYVLSGSNQFDILHSCSESLSGRACMINLSSLTQQEILQNNGGLFNPNIDILLKIENENKTCKYANQVEIFNRIFSGGMPEYIDKKLDRELFFSSYFQTYIEKDILRLINISKEKQFRDFLSIISLRTGQTLNINDISTKVGIDVNTTKKWLSILKSSGIIFFLQPYNTNASNRIIRTPKMYFYDTGLCSWLCKITSSEMLRNCILSGAFFETFVVSEIVKSFYNCGKSYKDSLFYYRDIDQKEVDLLYIKEGLIYPVEIKQGLNPAKPTKNFNILSKYNQKIMPGLVIDTSDKIRPINQYAYTFPVYLLGLI